MKRIIKLIIASIVLICIFCVTSKLTQDSSSAEQSTTTIVDNNGNKVNDRSGNPILRLSEFNYPTQQLRAAWVSLFVGSLPSYSNEENWKRDYSHVLDNMQAHGLNCIIFHVRTHNNAMYKSTLNPLSTWFKNVNFDEFDPLAWAIEETHRRGMEFHAWLNPYRINDSFVYGDIPSTNAASNPANILTSSSGAKILDPGKPNVRKFLVDTCMEVVENYDVDAIHFDDYFYISGVDDSATRQQYNPTNMAMADWRREQVNIFIRDLSNTIRTYNKNNHKAVSLGISPSGIYRNGSNSPAPKYDANGTLTSPLYSNTSGFAHYDNYLYSDTLHWINQEWIDYIMPQTYWALEHKVACFGELSKWWSYTVRYKKVNLYLGLGIYMAAESGSSANYWKQNNNEIRDQLLNAAIYPEIGGISLYSYNYISSSNDVISTGMELIANDYYKVKIPGDVKKYLATTLDTVPVNNLKHEQTTITWDKADNVRGYIVYRVPTGKLLDQNDISQVYYYGTENSLQVNDLLDFKATYHVSTVNLANEISYPKELIVGETSVESCIRFINALPSPITLDDGGLIQKIDQVYAELSAEEKTQVTNYQAFLTIKEVFNAKTKAYHDAINYPQLDKYTYRTQEIIKLDLATFKTKLNQALTKQNVESVYDSFITKINSYKVSSEELKTEITNAITSLNNLFSQYEEIYFNEANYQKLQTSYEAILLKINNAKSIDEINEAISGAKATFDAIPSIKNDYLENIELFEANFKQRVNYHLDQLSFLKEYPSYITETDALLATYRVKYEDIALRLLDTLAVAYDEIKVIVDHYVALDDAKVNALITIENYKQSLQIDSLRAEYIEKVEAASTPEQIEQLVKEFKEQAQGQTNPQSPQTGCAFGTIVFIQLLASTSLLFIFLRKH